MTRIAYPFALLSAMLVCALHAAPAHAATLRAFVSGGGSDSNTAANCGHAAPCRTFATALTVTSPGGEIVALDPAGYGPITISGPLSLVGVPGAAINVPSGGNGITINAGPNDAVHVQGLLIDGGHVGSNGIVFNTGKSLTVKNCAVLNLTSDGIDFFPNDSSNLAVSDTLVTNNGGNGISVIPTALSIFSRVESDNNGGDGFSISHGNATATDSVAAGNAGIGFHVADGGPTQGAELMVFRSVAANNGTGLAAGGGAHGILWVGQSTVTGNANGWSGSGVQSYGTNQITGNAANQGQALTVSSGSN